MIVVIQCAGSKRSEAGHLRRQDGTKVMFVADPTKAPPGSDCVYAHPDDVSDTGESWRQLLIRYNANPGNNPDGLLRASELYENKIYRRLADRFGSDRTYILSAGWGLVSASFLLPAYDITFSPSVRQHDPSKFRSKRSDVEYADLCQLPADTAEPVIFFGGKDYVPLFCKLTAAIASPRTIFFGASQPPKAPGCEMKHFSTTRKTNWHYQCAEEYLEGRISE